MSRECNRSTITFWDSIEVIDDITENNAKRGVVTLEGRIGPLLKGDGSQAYFIEMPGDLYCQEHPHPTESIIFTVKGNWVLCSSCHRQLMRPGSLFWFKAGTPTGYEVPFSESAFILIFKGDRDEKDDEGFLEYLRGLKVRLERAHEEGTPFKLSELSQDHPARVFARGLGAEGA